ncbi:hypothetical protein HanRHA438_Chr16g0770791 [Helianthus annuus]|nr:hypothetical protein HanRHA438_Chr16g0770791 [Helianthus annuus]
MLQPRMSILLLKGLSVVLLSSLSRPWKRWPRLRNFSLFGSMLNKMVRPIEEEMISWMDSLSKGWNNPMIQLGGMFTCHYSQFRTCLFHNLHILKKKPKPKPWWKPKWSPSRLFDHSSHHVQDTGRV